MSEVSLSCARGVLVRYPVGIELQDIYVPLWVSGTLKVEQVNNELVDAAYALEAEFLWVVEEEDL